MSARRSKRAEPQLYALDASEAPWGDYGAMLRHGMASSYERDTHGRIQLERTGPFVPPISFPGEVVVTDAIKRRMGRDVLPRSAFVPVCKKRIVRLAWHEWDAKADEPQRYPAGGEPENYILGRKHDAELARSLGELWEIRAVEKPGLQLPDQRIDPGVYAGEPVVRAAAWRNTFVSTELKRWLEEHLADWVRLTPARFG